MPHVAGVSAATWATDRIDPACDAGGAHPFHLEDPPSVPAPWVGALVMLCHLVTNGWWRCTFDLTDFVSSRRAGRNEELK